MSILLSFTVLLSLTAIAAADDPRRASKAEVEEIVLTRIQQRYCGSLDEFLPPDTEAMDAPDGTLHLPLPGYVGELEWPGCQEAWGCLASFWYEKAYPSSDLGFAILHSPCNPRLVRNLHDLVNHPLDLDRLSDKDLIDLSLMALGYENLTRAMMLGGYYSRASDRSGTDAPERPFYGCEVLTTPIGAAARESVSGRQERFLSWAIPPQVKRSSKRVEVSFSCVFGDRQNEVWHHVVKVSKKGRLDLFSKRTGFRLSQGVAVKE